MRCDIALAPTGRTFVIADAVFNAHESHSARLPSGAIPRCFHLLNNNQSIVLILFKVQLRQPRSGNGPVDFATAERVRVLCL